MKGEVNVIMDLRKNDSPKPPMDEVNILSLMVVIFIAIIVLINNVL